MRMREGRGGVRKGRKSMREEGVVEEGVVEEREGEGPGRLLTAIH